MLDQDENGDLQVKQGGLPLHNGTSDSSSPPRGWLARVWGACFRRRTEDVRGRSTDDLELGTVDPSSRGRQRSVLQQHTVIEVPAPLQVQWSGPSVSELRHETDAGEAVLTAARSFGDDDLGDDGDSSTASSTATSA